MEDKKVELVTKQDIPDHLIYKYSEANTVRDGDFAIFWDGPETKNQFMIKKRGSYQTKNGKIKHDDVIDKESYGSKIFQRMGYTVILKPNSNLYTQSISQRT
jgi:tRNA A58 N-methylase Trm61